MKQTTQSSVGPMTIYKSRNELGLSSMKRKRARTAANRIKTFLSSRKSENSSTSRAEECDFGSGFCLRQALIQNYSNFRRSGTPSRFMFFCNDAWNDFSQEVFGFLKDAFVAGMPVVECSVDGSACLFDFFRMLQMDLVIGRERSIAWIDVDGRCFFPKLVVGEEIKTVCEAPPPCPKVEIEIIVKKDFSEDSDKSSNSAKEHTDESPANDLDIPQNTSVDKPCIESDERPKWPYVEMLKEGGSSYMAIKNIFLSGIRTFTPDITISSISRCLHSGPLGNARLKAFQGQMEMTKAARGSANVRYAWYGTSAEGVASIITHGLGETSRLSSSEVYGVGVYLSPHHLSHISAALSPADGDGENHVILCRVIVGNAEKVDAGSLQFHPSSEEYDCGVDDLVNPRWYIVWNTHMNRHILPEYVVSFKSPDRLQGLSRTMSLSRRISSTSSYLSFPKLFSEMGKCLPSSQLQALERFYAQYKAGNINKEALIRQLRSIAGDKLLIATIRRVRGD